MAVPTSLLLFATLYLTLHRIDAYPTGPPTTACTSMTPTGHNSAPQSSNTPYTISLDSNTYSPGQTIRVTLSGAANTAFEGFFLQARRKDEFRDTTEAIGTFSTAPTGTKLLTCHNNIDSAWSHSSKDDKTTTSIDWVAPDGFEGSIAFRATVVQGPAQVYWQGVLSDIVTYDGPTAEPTTKETNGQASTHPITSLLAAAYGFLSLLFLWQQVYL